MVPFPSFKPFIHSPSYVIPSGEIYFPKPCLSPFNKDSKSLVSGNVKNGEKARLIREGIVLANTKIKSLQREKDTVKEVPKGMDCGITLENYQDIKEGDLIEVYEEREIKR